MKFSNKQECWNNRIDLYSAGLVCRCGTSASPEGLYFSGLIQAHGNTLCPHHHPYVGQEKGHAECLV